MNKKIPLTEKIFSELDINKVFKQFENEILCIKDSSGKYIVCNKSWCYYFDLKEGDVIGKTIKDLNTFFKKEDIDCILFHDYKVIFKKKKINYILRVHHPINGSGDLFVISFPLFDQAGKINAVVSVSYDLNLYLENIGTGDSPHVAGQAVWNKNAKAKIFDSVMDFTSDAILICDSNDNILKANKKTSELLEINRSELKKRKINDLLFEQNRETYLAIKNDLNAYGSAKAKFELVKGNNNRIHINGKFSKVYMHTGLSVLYVAFLQKVTYGAPYDTDNNDYKLIENIASRIGDMFIMIDENACIEFCNQQLLNESGYFLEDLIGKPIFNFIHNDDVHIIAELFYRKVFDNNTKGPIYVKMFKKNGKIRNVSINPGDSWKMKNGQNIIYAVMKDITDNVITEEKYQEKLLLHDLISEISTRLINSNSDYLDIEIDFALEKIGTFFKTDRCFLCFIDREKNSVIKYSEWCRDGVQSKDELISALTPEKITTLGKYFSVPESIYFFDSDNIIEVPHFGKCTAGKSNMKSTMVMPIAIDEKTWGYFGLNFINYFQDLNENVEFYIVLCGKFFANAFRKFISDIEKNRLKEELLNLVLSSLSEQEQKTLLLEADGLSTAEISRTLGTTKETIYTYKYRIRKKIGSKEIIKILEYLQKKNNLVQG